jgi:hypothetical protein
MRVTHRGGGSIFLEKCREFDRDLLETSLGEMCGILDYLENLENLENLERISERVEHPESPGTRDARIRPWLPGMQGAGREGDSRVLTHTAATHIGARPTANSFAGSQQERVAADIHRVSANLIEGEHHAYRYIAINPTVVGESFVEMAGEKRSQDQDEILLARTVLVDIEGTTTSVSFVKVTHKGHGKNGLRVSCFVCSAALVCPRALVIVEMAGAASSICDMRVSLASFRRAFFAEQRRRRRSATLLLLLLLPPPAPSPSSPRPLVPSSLFPPRHLRCTLSPVPTPLPPAPPLSLSLALSLSRSLALSLSRLRASATPRNRSVSPRVGLSPICIHERRDPMIVFRVEPVYAGSRNANPANRESAPPPPAVATRVREFGRAERRARRS